MTLPVMPHEPEYLDDAWYYKGFSRYMKTEAFEVYNADRVQVLQAWLAETMELLNFAACYVPEPGYSDQCPVRQQRNRIAALREHLRNEGLAGQ